MQMNYRKSAFPAALMAFGCVVFLSIEARADEQSPLTSYNAAIGESSISGISSGAFMAVQFGTAWSSVIKGVGVVAGGPFYCAQAQADDIINGFTLPIMIATGPCMQGPAPDEADGKSISEMQFLALTHSAGNAKVAMLEDERMAEFPIAVPSRGSSLFGATVSTKLDRRTLEQVILEGFFARTAIEDLPQKTRRAGLQEFGLPYASDPVISKHLARFLTRSLENVQSSETLRSLIGAQARSKPFLAPTAVLFNGGVFKAAPIRRRVLDLLAAWNEGETVRELAGYQPDLAVAKGASLYGRNRIMGKGLRIKAGASRSYYIGLETSMPAVPGFNPPLKALCVVPQGMEEGSEVLIEGRDLALVTGQPAEFRFFSSDVRSGDAPGEIIPDAERELLEISLLEVDLAAVEDIPVAQPVPVQINAVVTELGNLELWMKHTKSDRRWKVEFQVRTE